MVISPFIRMIVLSVDHSLSFLEQNRASLSPEMVRSLLVNLQFPVRFLLRPSIISLSPSPPLSFSSFPSSPWLFSLLSPHPLPSSSRLSLPNQHKNSVVHVPTSHTYSLCLDSSESVNVVPSTQQFCTGGDPHPLSTHTHAHTISLSLSL